MLAIFDKSVAKSPEALQTPNSSGSISALKEGFLANEFANLHPGSVTVNLASAGIMAHSLDKQNPFLPRIFAAVDDIFCLFQGHVDNIANLKNQYGLNKTANEAIIVIEAYRTLRDRGPYPPEQDAEGSTPFYWGTDADGCLVLSDEADIVKKGCGKSFAPFPKGCFFTTSGGLRSFEHPSKELKAVPRVDSQGDVCGATFKVDQDSKKESIGMKKVGSEANWSTNY
ncbi:unnamed protein product [Rhodiola kirilowii]